MHTTLRSVKLIIQEENGAAHFSRSQQKTVSRNARRGKVLDNHTDPFAETGVTASHKWSS